MSVWFTWVTKISIFSEIYGHCSVSGGLWVYMCWHVHWIWLWFSWGICSGSWLTLMWWKKCWRMSCWMVMFISSHSCLISVVIVVFGLVLLLEIKHSFVDEASRGLRCCSPYGWNLSVRSVFSLVILYVHVYGMYKEIYYQQKLLNWWLFLKIEI